MITIVNKNLGTERIAALRVVDKCIRKFTFTASTETPVQGESIHFEAKGLVAVEGVPIPRREGICNRTTHRHVLNDTANPELEGEDKRWYPNMSPGVELCIIPDYFPVSLHIDVPVGDVLPPALGDNIVVTIRRGDATGEQQYLTSTEKTACSGTAPCCAEQHWQRATS